MDKKIYKICLLSIVLSSCTNFDDEIDNYSDDKIIASSLENGTFNYDAQKYQEVEPMQSFIYDPSDSKNEHIIVKKNVYNLDNLYADILNNNEINGNIYWEDLLKSSEGGYSKDPDKDNYIYHFSYFYNIYLKTSVWYKYYLYDVLVSNPERYYTSDFLIDLEKLENDEITTDDLFEIYGDKVANSYDYIAKLNFDLSLDCRNCDGLFNNSNLIYTYLASGGYNLSLEETTKVKNMLNKYNLTISISTSENLPNFDSYMAYALDKSQKIYNYTFGKYVNPSCENFVIPNTYTHAIELLGSRFTKSS